MTDLDIYCLVNSQLKNKVNLTQSIDLYIFILTFSNLSFELLTLILLILMSNDVETNPGPTHDSNSSNPCKQMSFMHVNIRSLLSKEQNTTTSKNPFYAKFYELQAIASVNTHDLIAITETWLDDTIPNSEIMIPNYLPPERKDRNRHGGGIMIYQSSCLSAIRRPDLEPPNYEIMCFEIQKPQKMLFCCGYRPQWVPSADFLESFKYIFDSIVDDQFKSIIITGDMNAKHSEWYSADRTCHNGRLFKTFFESNNYTQLISEPTHYDTFHQTESCLDHIFTNTPNLFVEAHTTPKISNCDHSPIVGLLNINTPRLSTYKRKIWNFREGNYEKLNNLLTNAPWEAAIVQENPNESCNIFMDILEKIIEECIPSQIVTIRPKDKPWMTSEIRKLIRKRNRLHKIYKRTKTPQTERKYKDMRNCVVSKIRETKQNYEIDQLIKLENCNINSRSWWKCIKSKLGLQKPNIDSPLLHNNQMITDDQHKAEIFNNYFIQQGIIPEPNTDLSFYDDPEHTLDIKTVDREEVYKLLLCLKPDKATGPDNIGNFILKMSATSLAEPLTHLFNKLLKSGTYPDIWKRAHVLPLFKKDNPSHCNNYRPISLLPNISKVFEKIVFNHIYNFLSTYNLLSSKQSGFRPGDSTINQLLKICHNIYSTLDTGEEILAIFIDFTKAFDRVWTEGLLHKIKRIGITGKLYLWLESYLSNRMQCVVLNGKQSTWRILQAGVPQGSVLGPLLFLLYINDITHRINSDIFLYADDTCLFKTIKQNSFLTDKDIFMNDLITILNWCEKWNIKVNLSKTKTIVFSRKPTPSEIPVVINNNLLQNTTTHKHLGLIFCNNMTWKQHIESITIKASKTINMFKTIKHNVSIQTLLSLYVTFVRPILEYGDVIFDNCDLNDCNKIESIQNEAVRIVTGAKKGSSITYLLNELNLDPLHKRRTNHKLIKIHQIIHTDCKLYLKEMLPRALQSNTRGSASKQFAIPKCRSELYRKSFIPSSISLWNNLSSETRLILPKLQFKNKLFYRQPKHEYYFLGNRKTQRILCQMRVDFSDLNFHLFSKNCSDTPNCSHCLIAETPIHYFLECPKYTNQRNLLLEDLTTLCPDTPITINLLLHGKYNSNTNINKLILQAISQYIELTDRFK